MCHALPRACAVPLMAQAFFLAIPRKRQWEEKLFLWNFCYFCENSATLFRVHDLVVSSFLYEKIVGLVWILACSFPNEWLFTIRKFVLIALIVLKIRMINLFPETKCTPVRCKPWHGSVVLHRGSDRRTLISLFHRPSPIRVLSQILYQAIYSLISTLTS